MRNCEFLIREFFVISIWCYCYIVISFLILTYNIDVFFFSGHKDFWNGIDLKYYLQKSIKCYIKELKIICPIIWFKLQMTQVFIMYNIDHYQAKVTSCHISNDVLIFGMYLEVIKGNLFFVYLPHNKFKYIIYSNICNISIIFKDDL